MELTGKERLMLVKKKEEIQKLTSEILDAFEATNNLTQMTEIKKKLLHVLSILSTIGSYAKPKTDLTLYESMVDLIFYKLYLLENLERKCGKSDLSWKNAIGINIEEFCIYANSIRFEFTKKGIKIHIPKIEFSIFKQTKERF